MRALRSFNGSVHVTRKFCLWSALAAFALLNVGGEALHHAEIFGFHQHEKASSCDCVLHYRDSSSQERDSADDVDWQQCDHTCALCQYYAQAKPDEHGHETDGSVMPPSPDHVLRPYLAASSVAVHSWFARGPPLA